MSFVHLHNHSEYSLLDGLMGIDDMIERASDLGQRSLGLTDHGWLSGCVKFRDACRKAGIKPVLGCEVYVSKQESAKEKASGHGDNWHLTLLAETREGWRNMSSLSTKSFLEGMSYKPRVDKSMLAEHSEGIVLLTGCFGSEMSSLLIKGDERGASDLLAFYCLHFNHVFVEVMNHGGNMGISHVKEEDERGNVLMEEHELNDALRDLADSFGLPMVATNDAHYASCGDGSAHDTLLCVNTKKSKSDKDRFAFPGSEHDAFPFYISDEGEMRSMCKEAWWQEACDNSVLVASICDDDVLPEPRPFFEKEEK